MAHLASLANVTQAAGQAGIGQTAKIHSSSKSVSRGCGQTLESGVGLRVHLSDRKRSVQSAAVMAPPSPREASQSRSLSQEPLVLDLPSISAAEPRPSGRGGGGWRPVRQRNGGRATTAEKREVEEVLAMPWLSGGDVNLSTELLVAPEELCARSSAGLLDLQHNIWRLNRRISRAASVKEALQIVQDMKSSAVNVANEGTYLALITLCRRQRQGDRALVVYEAMKAAGMTPSLLTYNTLISCCHQAQRLEDAFRLKADMDAAGVRPDVVTYTALMALVIKVGPYRGRASPVQRLNRCMDLLAEMQGAGVVPDAVTFNTLMAAAAQARLPGRVLEVYGMMAAARVSPTAVTFETLLEAVGASGRLKSALEVLREVRSNGVAPTTAMYNHVIAACASAPQPKAATAWQLYSEMAASKDFLPNEDTFAALISVSAKVGDHAGALRAFDLMKKSGFGTAISAATYNKLIHCGSVAKGAEGAFEMYNLMRAAGFRPDAVTYSSLVAACARERDCARALTVVQEMEALGVQPNQIVFHSMMCAFGSVGRWQEAVATYRRMLEECKEAVAGAATFGILFDACVAWNGADAHVTEAAAAGEPLQLSPGWRAACGLYDEAVRGRVFQNFSPKDLTRCDVRAMPRSGVVVAVVAWLEAIREGAGAAERPLTIVTGAHKEQAPADPSQPPPPAVHAPPSSTTWPRAHSRRWASARARSRTPSCRA